VGNLSSIATDDQQWMLQRLTRGLNLLLVASKYVESSHCEKCQLALRREELSAAGLEAIDCRWMLIRGLVDHFNETTFPGDSKRSFRNGDAIISDHSCFLLTPKGTSFVTEFLNEPHAEIGSTTNEVSFNYESQDGSHPRWGSQDLIDETEPSTDPQPCWDINRQELWFAGRLVKRYRIPSPNQVAILCAFEEETWPSRIDDPLPQHFEIDPRRRLNDTIRNLNRSRINPLIRFSGDGSGQGILWEPTDAFSHP
jgi:hypothetical protein